MCLSFASDFAPLSYLDRLNIHPNQCYMMEQLQIGQFVCQPSQMDQYYGSFQFTGFNQNIHLTQLL